MGSVGVVRSRRGTVESVGDGGPGTSVRAHRMGPGQEQTGIQNPLPPSFPTNTRRPRLVH
ncbi:unnamed protein product [Nyctereutes procyonoides]|uniref:(raccoon dog) hypothetical protein n=1 Tax=Nyctereutes procyonoides TaxID=34880 RepID=A0A811YDM8_NYCPR|nr:unnamed protein product [Nyctereutes procyonoides]